MNNLRNYVNWKLTHADKTAEAEGYPLVLENCKINKRMKQLEIYGNSFQDGTPTPDAPIEVQSVGELVTDVNDANYGKYKIPIVQRGVNLWDKASYIQSTSTTKGLRYQLYSSDYNWISKGETVTISATVYLSENDTRTNPRMSVHTDGVDGSVNRSSVASINVRDEEIKLTIKYTIPDIEADIKSLTIMFINYGSNNGGVWNGYVKDIQIELGATATPYEPYVEPTSTNIFLNEPLRKIGDYADYVDFKNKCVVKKTSKVVFDGSEDWKFERLSAGNNFYTYISNAYGDSAKPVLCNMGLYYSKGSLDNVYSCRISPSKNFNFRYADYNNLIDYKNKLAEMYSNNEPLYAIYILATPTEETILCELPKLSAKTTITEVCTSIAPSDAYGKYIKR